MRAREILEQSEAFRGVTASVHREMIGQSKLARLDIGTVLFGAPRRNRSLDHMPPAEICLVAGAIRQRPAQAAALARSVVVVLSAWQFRHRAQQNRPCRTSVLKLPRTAWSKGCHSSSQSSFSRWINDSRSGYCASPHDRAAGYASCRPRMHNRPPISTRDARRRGDSVAARSSGTTRNAVAASPFIEPPTRLPRRSQSPRVSDSDPKPQRSRRSDHSGERAGVIWNLAFSRISFALLNHSTDLPKWRRIKHMSHRHAPSNGRKCSDARSTRRARIVTMSVG